MMPAAAPLLLSRPVAPRGNSIACCARRPVRGASFRSTHRSGAASVGMYPHCCGACRGPPTSRRAPSRSPTPPIGGQH